MGLMLGSKYEDDPATLTVEQVIDALNGRLKDTRVLIEDDEKHLYRIRNIFILDSLVVSGDGSAVIIISALNREGL